MLQPRQDESLQQGDVIRNVPWLLLPRLVNVKAVGVQGQARLDSQAPEGVHAVLAHGGGKPLSVNGAPLVLDLGIIVTQSCDLDYKPHLTLARVFPLVDLVLEAKEAVQHREPLVLYDTVRNLTEGLQHANLVYLSAPDSVNRVVADLLQVQSFEATWKGYFKHHRLVGLTEEGLKYLQGRLNLFTGRYATETGFWRLADEHGLAKQVESDPSALEQAYARLEQKRRPPLP
jgi:hypothetical protein